MVFLFETDWNLRMFNVWDVLYVFFRWLKKNSQICVDNKIKNWVLGTTVTVTFEKWFYLLLGHMSIDINWHIKRRQRVLTCFTCHFDSYNCHFWQSNTSELCHIDKCHFRTFTSDNTQISIILFTRRQFSDDNKSR